MLSRFFIDRPIFAAVISMFLVLAGLAAMRVLPIAQYPEIAPPVVTVTAVYPGASAETLEQTVAAPIENAINGVPNMIYMSSTSSSNGVVSMQVTFDIGTNVDDAAVNVNNRVKQVEPRLPEEVRRQGVTVERGSSAFLQVLAFYSPDEQLRRPLHLELRHAQRARPAEAAARHDQCADLRRKGLRHADLAPAGSPDAAQDDALGRDPGGQRAERAIRGRQGGPGTDRQGAGPHVHHHHAGALLRCQGVRQHHRARGPERLDGAALGRGACRAGLQGLRLHRPLQRQGSNPRRHLPAARRECARGRQDRAHHDGRPFLALPAGTRACRPLRHDALRRGLDQGSGLHARRGDDPRVPGRVPLPAELARDDHPARRGAGLAARRVRRAAGPGLLDQHADAVRHGAGDRHRRRRRDRRARERRAHHAGGRRQAARGGDQGDAGGDRTDHRDRAHADRGVRADRVPGRPHGRALSPVRGDDLHRGGDLGPRRAHAHARRFA